MLTRSRLNNNANGISYLNLWIIDAVETLYESFDDFLMDLRLRQADARPIDSLWATYQAGGIESAHYVEEDYASGVGRWFCPYPSPLSENDAAAMGITGGGPDNTLVVISHTLNLRGKN